MTCSTPLYEMLINDPHGWIPCPTATQGPGLTGVAMLLWFTVFIMMANWSEGFKLPIAWTMLFATIIIGALPGDLASRLIGVAILATAAGFYYLWQVWRR